VKGEVGVEKGGMRYGAQGGQGKESVKVSGRDCVRRGGSVKPCGRRGQVLPGGPAELRSVRRVNIGLMRKGKGAHHKSIGEVVVERRLAAFTAANSDKE